MKRIVLAVILVAALALASAAAGGTSSMSGGHWLTVAQAKHKVATETVVFGWTCDTWSGSPNYCPQDYMRSVSLRILSGTIRGIGGSLRYKRKTYFQNFYINAKCASDFRTGQQVHGQFEWGWNGKYWETTNLADRTQTGRFYPGCTG